MVKSSTRFLLRWDLPGVLADVLLQGESSTLYQMLRPLYKTQVATMAKVEIGKGKDTIGKA
jgi:hypothetical protein